MRLYHTGFQEIRKPDVHYGRKNADFGQGFYLTGDEAFAHRWAREQKGAQTILNTYELDTDGLTVHRFQRDAEWFHYIFGNRRGRPDERTDDLIIGPIANDIIYDTFGIITSGFLAPEEAMELLMIGPEYVQIVLKTEKAAEHLKWESSLVLQPEELAGYRKLLAEEEAEYQRLFGSKLNAF